MKIYIATRFQKKKIVRKWLRRFKELGYEPVADWTNHKSIKPYKENFELSEQYSIEAIRGVKDSDVFILISDEAGTGMYIELGRAISSYLERGKPKIYVVGKYNSRSMFFFHPSVNRRRTIQEVFEEIKE